MVTKKTDTKVKKKKPKTFKATPKSKRVSEDLLNVQADKSRTTKKNDEYVLQTYLAGESFLLDVNMIENYDKNPRTAENEMFDEIYHSIKTTGFRGVFEITLRPGDKKYITNAGAGTRLRAVHKLALETGEDRFKTVRVVFFPYIDESTLIFNGWSENNQRAPLCFIDNAFSIHDQKNQLEKKLDKTLSAIALVEALKPLGYTKISKSAVIDGMYAVKHLNAAIPNLSRKHKINENDNPGIGRKIINDIRKYYHDSLRTYLNSSISDHQEKDWYKFYFDTLASFDDHATFDMELFKLEIVKRLGKNNPDVAEKIERSQAEDLTNQSIVDSIDHEDVDSSLEKDDSNSESKEEDIKTDVKDIGSTLEPITKDLPALRETMFSNAKTLVKNTGIEKCFNFAEFGLGYIISIPPKNISKYDLALWWLLCDLLDVENAPSEIKNKYFTLFLDALNKTDGEVNNKFWNTYTEVLTTEEMSSAHKIFLFTANSSQFEAFQSLQNAYIEILSLTKSNIWSE